MSLGVKILTPQSSVTIQMPLLRVGVMHTFENSFWRDEILKQDLGTVLL